MSWKRFAVGVGTGVAVTILAKNQLNKLEKPVSAEKALKLVKAKTKHLGSIEGSWIHMKTEEFEQDTLVYSVYRGGITVALHENELKAYEFFVDSDTGTILSFIEQE